MHSSDQARRQVNLDSRGLGLAGSRQHSVLAGHYEPLLHFDDVSWRRATTSVAWWAAVSKRLRNCLEERERRRTARRLAVVARGSRGDSKTSTLASVWLQGYRTSSGLE